MRRGIQTLIFKSRIIDFVRTPEYQINPHITRIPRVSEMCREVLLIEISMCLPTYPQTRASTSFTGLMPHLSFINHTNSLILIACPACLINKILACRCNGHHEYLEVQVELYEASNESHGHNTLFARFGLFQFGWMQRLPDGDSAFY